MEGNLCFKIDWASLIVGRKSTVFALCYFVFEGNFQVQAPGGLIFGGKGQRSRFFALRVQGTYIWSGLYMERLIFGILRYSNLIHPRTQEIQYSKRIQDFILILNHKAYFLFLFKVTPGVSGYIPIKFPRGKPKFTQICVQFIHRGRTKSV